MTGLDPVIQSSFVARKLDCRVEPGNEERGIGSDQRLGCRVVEAWRSRIPGTGRAGALLLGLVLLLAGLAPARAQDWVLNATASRLHMQTIKANSVIETHRFTGLDGTVTKDGSASVKIDLVSVATGIDVRDVRMRFLLFEAYKFPLAEITAKLDMAQAAGAVDQHGRITYPLKFTLAMHGVTQEIETPVTVKRISDQSVSVASAQPIVVTAESFGLTARRRQAVGGGRRHHDRARRLDSPSTSCSRPATRCPSCEAARGSRAAQSGRSGDQR